jgi:hypothetical protein
MDARRLLVYSQTEGKRHVSGQFLHSNFLDVRVKPPLLFSGVLNMAVWKV